MLDKEKLKQILFPHDEVREIQDQLILDVEKTIEDKKSLIMHAPTGLGKTASTLPVALAYAAKHNKTVFFLTSRHTQHKIAVDTLKEIKAKHELDFTIVDIIGKKWMCSVPGIDILSSGEFSEFCKQQVEDEKCEFYTNTKKGGKATVKAQKLMEEISQPLDTEEMIERCSHDKLCPYYISTMLAGKAKVIVADYYYIFNPAIRETFFNRTEKLLQDSIIIVDEAHNLPIRVRELMTGKLSSYILSRAIKEAKKFDFTETFLLLESIRSMLNDLSENMDDEKLVTKQEFIDAVDTVKEYEELIADFKFIGDDVREQQKQSWISMVGVFLEKWLGDDKGFARILSKTYYKGQENLTLSYRCLDPSMITKQVFEEAHSSVLMSGTLTPTEMYCDILGLPDNTVEKVYENPFPEDNKLSMIIPQTSTKYTMRSDEMFRKIGEITADIVNEVPGNTAIFFPSYMLRDQVNLHFSQMSKKTTFLEAPGLTKQEKLDLLENFKQYKDSGAALLGVSAGSFGEGIDLPGDLLKCVIVVGLPLNKPDLETKELITYYDEKFSKGWDYGYIFPAFNRCLQSAGRCIRSASDRGVVIFLDERFAWPNYKRLFPQDMDIKLTMMYKDRISEFFE